MTSFVLVHGGMHGSWCWEKVVPQLEQCGHQVAAIDLRGNDDTADPTQVTLDDWTQQIVAALEAQTDPCVLVGHSMGGVPVTTAASVAAERITDLVYVCAVIPAENETAQHSAAREAVADQIVSADEWVSQTFPREVAYALLYADCDPEIAAAALDRLTPQPTRPLTEPPRVQPDQLAGIRRHYIHTTEDRAISPEVQRGYIASVPGISVYEIHSGHSPFYAAPNDLAAILLQIAERAVRPHPPVETTR